MWEKIIFFSKHVGLLSCPGRWAANWFHNPHFPSDIRNVAESSQIPPLSVIVLNAELLCYKLKLNANQSVLCKATMRFGNFAVR